MNWIFSMDFNPHNLCNMNYNGREKPMFIITTDFEHSIKDIIVLYPPRWLIELGIKAETKFFDLNQLASVLDIKINFDTFLTQIVHALYRLMGHNRFL